MEPLELLRQQPSELIASESVGFPDFPILSNFILVDFDPMELNLGKWAALSHDVGVIRDTLTNWFKP